MPYMIATYYKPGRKHVLDAVRAKHVEYLELNADKMIIGGAKWTDDNSSVIGGLMVIDVETKAEAEAFIANDPFFAVDLFERVEMTPFRQSFLVFKKVPPAAPQRG